MKTIFKSDIEEHSTLTTISRYVQLTKINGKVISPSKIRTEDLLIARNEIVFI